MRLFTISILVFFSSAVFAQNFTWTPQASGVTAQLYDVYFTDNQTGWAVGNDGIIVNTTDGGQNWVPQTSGTTERIRAVFFIDANTGWAVGGVSNKVMLKTTDGGLNWSDIAPANIVNNQIRDIAFADTNTGWVIVYDSIYLTTDGGENWTIEPYSTGEPQMGFDHKAIAVTSDTTSYIAGTRRRNTTGSTYADVFNKNPYQSPLYFYGAGVENFNKDDKLRCIAFSNYSTGFAGGDKGIIYRFEQEDPYNMAGPWKINLDLSSANISAISSISFPSESNGMFNVGTDISGTSYALIYHTADTGNTWSATPDTIPELLVATIHAPDTANAWIVGLGGKIYKGVRITTGIRRMESDFDINIYPNPTTDIITVEINLEINELVTYSLLDISGRLIKNGKWNLNSSGSRFTLDLSDISKGTYLLKLNTNKGQAVHRILKN